MVKARVDVQAERYAESIGAYIAFFDGCCEPKNPGGTAGFGCLILRNGVQVWEHSGMIDASPATSNQVAEYLAFTAILDWFIAEGACDQPILIKGDSLLVIQQMFGTWKIHGIDCKGIKGFYADYAKAARDKLTQFRAVKGTWIPREQNSAADDLSKAMLIRAGVEFRIQPLDKEKADA